MDDGDGRGISTSVGKKELERQIPLITQGLRPDSKAATNEAAVLLKRNQKLFEWRHSEELAAFLKQVRPGSSAEPTAGS